FTAHVVGFGLTRQQGEQLACLAHNTGGQYFAANDSARLSEALSATLRATRQAPAPAPEPEPELVLHHASLDAPEAAGAGTVIEIGWTGPGSRDDFITIIRPDAPDTESGVYERTSKGNPLRLQTPDALGPHEVRYVLAESNAVL